MHCTALPLRYLIFKRRYPLYYLATVHAVPCTRLYQTTIQYEHSIVIQEIHAIIPNTRFHDLQIAQYTQQYVIVPPV